MSVPFDPTGTYFAIDIREQHGLRTLHFGSARIQGAMLVERPWDLALEYTREMMVALLLRKGGSAAAGPFPRDVLLIGLGAGSQAKFLYRNFPQARLTAVEIEPHVVEAARQHFMLPDDPERLEIVVNDGFDYVRDCGHTFDLILVDGFNQHAHPGELNTQPFYESCRDHLGSQGVLAVNLIGLSARSKGGYRYIEAAFGNRSVLLPRCESGNTIALAATGETIDLTLNELMARALELKARTGLALLPTVTALDGEPGFEEGRLRL